MLYMTEVFVVAESTGAATVGGVYLLGGDPLQAWGPFNLFKWNHQEYQNTPIFSNLGLSASCWVRLICAHELWSTLASYPFPITNFLGLAGGKHYIIFTPSTLSFHCPHMLAWLLPMMYQRSKNK